MPVKKYLKESIKLGDKDLTVETGRVAKQADGSIVIQYGDTMLLVAAVSAPNQREGIEDRKSTRLNSSHLVISYAVFCLKKKIKKTPHDHNCITLKHVA